MLRRARFGPVLTLLVQDSLAAMPLLGSEVCYAFVTGVLTCSAVALRGSGRLYPVSQG